MMIETDKRNELNIGHRFISVRHAWLSGKLGVSRICALNLSRENRLSEM